VSSFVAKINSIKNWQAALAVTCLGLATFSRGLANPFLGDDIDQIVNNPVVHSLSNAHLLFAGSTFYNGGGIAPLSGIYYRPLMSTAYSIVYALFGAQPVAFHLFQLVVCIASAFLLYLICKGLAKPYIALVAAALFLVHPLNSEIVFAIPALQDALFVFFGLLAFCVLLYFHSTRSLFVVAGCLFLSFLSKESGLLFAIMIATYLVWFDKKRLKAFMAILATPLIVYLILKLHAVGLGSPSHNAPIDSVSFAGRLLTVPAIIELYIVKFVFPLSLASGYFFVYSSVSFDHFFVPLLVDLVAIATIVFAGYLVHRRKDDKVFSAFLFFAVWATLGLTLHLQVFPLDFTASETWFYFPMIGILGMACLLLESLMIKVTVHQLVFVSIALLVIATFAIRSTVRAADWSSLDVLAASDIAASKDDYNAYLNKANSLILQGKFNEAEPDVLQSIKLHPSYTNYYDYGLILAHRGDYEGTIAALRNGLKYGDYNLIYQVMTELTLVSGTAESDKQLLLEVQQKYPTDSKIWLYSAIFYDLHNDNTSAQLAITKAAQYGSIPQSIYGFIMNNQPYTVGAPDLGRNIVIP